MGLGKADPRLINLLVGLICVGIVATIVLQATAVSYLIWLEVK